MLCQRNYWRTSCTSRFYLQRALQLRHKTGPPGFLGRGSKEGQSSPTFDLWWHVSLAVHCHKSRYFLHFLQICPDGDWCIQLKCQEKVFLILSWYQRINSLFCLSKDCDNCCALTKTWFWCWNSACAGVMSAFVFLSAAIPWVLTLTFIGSIALSKGPWRFWLHYHEYSHALMLGCWNSPWWQSCEHCNTVCLPSGRHCSLDSNSMVVTCLLH